LIEILVALAVVAVALAAGSQATSALTRAASRQSDQWLAQLCAENELIRLRLLRQLPGVGESTGECSQAGRTLRLRVAVQPTPNPNFRRIDAMVESTVDGADVRLLSVSTIMGRY
jgi:general secretion pathway protein I